MVDLLLLAKACFCCHLVRDGEKNWDIFFIFRSWFFFLMLTSQLGNTSL